MFELKTLRMKLGNVIIGGITSINRALISKENHDRHVIYAEGLGLKRVLNTEGVDTRRTYTNHISEVEECLGVEAARQSIINQITETMREHGVNVNPRHINLLSEVMTCKGRIIGFTRNDIDKAKDSTIMLASFEKTTDFLFDAATQGKHDRMRGVSEKIIMGQPITIGTGMFDVRQEIKKPLVYGK
jgi:DNA-directed RNA polymerase III subunit RPC1